MCNIELEKVHFSPTPFFTNQYRKKKTKKRQTDGAPREKEIKLVVGKWLLPSLNHTLIDFGDASTTQPTVTSLPRGTPTIWLSTLTDGGTFCRRRHRRRRRRHRIRKRKKRRRSKVITSNRYNLCPLLLLSLLLRYLLHVLTSATKKTVRMWIRLTQNCHGDSFAHCWWDAIAENFIIK